MTDTLDLALDVSGCDSATVIARPRLSSDNGSSCIADDLADHVEDKGMDRVRGAPQHPQTQARIERWHQPMNRRSATRIIAYCSGITSCHGDLEHQIRDVVEYHTTRRYHESLGNLTPTDVYFGRGEQILELREEIKRKTMLKRRLHHETENA